MADYCIVYPNPNGGICVVFPVVGAIPVEQAMNAVPSGSQYIVMDPAQLPQDTTFRNAWEADFTGAQVKS